MFVQKQAIKRVYNKNMFIQHSHKHENRKLSGREKLAFVELENAGTYIRIEPGFSLYSLTKQTRQKEEETETKLS